MKHGLAEALALGCLLSCALLSATARAQTPAPLPPPAPLDSEQSSRRARVSNTWTGAAGGLHIVDASSGKPGSVRLQLAADMFSTSDFMIAGDVNDYFGATLSAGVTAIEHLELYGSLHNHANGNTMERPQLLQVIGDAMLGGKGYASPEPWLSVGGDVRLLFLNAIGGVGPALKSTSIGVRGLIRADLRELESNPYPLILRSSLDYFFDNSSLLIDEVEDARYASLGETRRTRASEDRHLIRRVERFALNIQRNDMLTLGLGVERPLHLGGSWFLHPLIEWTLGIPINRQAYDCLLVATDTGNDDPDGCLSIEGLSAMPSTFTLGTRVFPTKLPISFLIGFDIGVTGVSTFVRELAPNRPWAFLIGLSYTADSVKPTVQQVVVQRVVTLPPPPWPRIHGTVVDAITGAGIEGAIVRYVDLELTAQATDAAGRFVSYPLEATQVRIEASHPQYAPATCAVSLPARHAATAMTSGSAPSQPASSQSANVRQAGAVGDLQLNPYLHKPIASGAGGAQAPIAPPTATLRCELTPKPSSGALQGQVVGPEGEAVLGAQIMLTGPASQLLNADARGLFEVRELPVGTYAVRVEAEGYLLKLLSIDVAANSHANLQVALVPKPETSQVELTAQEVRIRSQIFFRPNSAELSDRSNGLLTEIADVLLRNPHVALLEVQGHTDNSGVPAQNRALSQARAEEVRAWLIGAGVASGRLTAVGYGDSRPLVPNITDRNRARNRRVQFIIR